jgi:hypothetical protein
VLFVHGSHARVIDAAEDWGAALIIDSFVLDLDDRHASDLVGVKESEVDCLHFVEFNVRLSEFLACSSTHL